MRRKINIRLIQTAALAIFATLLLTVAVCYHILRNQVLDDLKSYAGIVKYIVTEGFSEEEKEELEQKPEKEEAASENNILPFQM